MHETSCFGFGNAFKINPILTHTQVVMTDKGETLQRSSEVAVNVELLDINNNSPVFVEELTSDLSLYEREGVQETM